METVESMRAFVDDHAGPLRRISETIEQISNEANLTLAPLTLAAQHIRRLL